jgi:hypothetical protein
MLVVECNDKYKTDDAGHTSLDITTQYREVPLSELAALLPGVITPAWQDKVISRILNALSGIPDYQDNLQTVYEVVSPSRDGVPVEGASYFRFPRNLQTQFVDPVGGATFTVPGIVLSYDHIVMRTEGVLVEALLGGGPALDEYSQKLQEVAVAERQVAVAERQARLDQLSLGRELVKTKDADAAAVYSKVFALPPTAPLIDIGSHDAGN